MQNHTTINIYLSAPPSSLLTPVLADKSEVNMIMEIKAHALKEMMVLRAEMRGGPESSSMEVHHSGPQASTDTRFSLDI